MKNHAAKLAAIVPCLALALAGFGASAAAPTQVNCAFAGRSFVVNWTVAEPVVGAPYSPGWIMSMSTLAGPEVGFGEGIHLSWNSNAGEDTCYGTIGYGFNMGLMEGHNTTICQGANDTYTLPDEAHVPYGATMNVFCEENFESTLFELFAPDEPGAAVCGDGLRDSGEDCDDGNNDSGDGCSATCQIEEVTPPPDEGTASEPVTCGSEARPCHYLQIEAPATTAFDQTTATDLPHDAMPWIFLGCFVVAWAVIYFKIKNG